MTTDEALARIAEQTIPQTRVRYVFRALRELLLFEFVVKFRGYKRWRHGWDGCGLARRAR